MKVKEHIEYILKNYHQIKREIEMLEPLIKRRYYVEDLREGSNSGGDDIERDVIEAVALKSSWSGDYTKVQSNTLDDRTSSLALLYKDIASREAKQALKIQSGVEKNKEEIFKVETILETLEEREKRVIKGIYFERKSRMVLGRDLFVSDVTLNRIRKKAIEKIVKAYNVYFCIENLGKL